MRGRRTSIVLSTQGRRGRVPCASALKVVIVALTVASPAASRAQESPVIRAMQDELRRSMTELRLKEEPPPYFVAYKVEDTAATRITASLGAVIRNVSGRNRTLQVDVRVGDYMFDNSNFVERRGGMGQTFTEASTSVSLDDDYDAMRRQIWLATDAAYKRAVGILARKKALNQNVAAIRSVPDFSRESPAETVVPGASPAQASGEWVTRARQVSEVFTASPDIQTSDVSIWETHGTRYYLNSEGSKAVTPVHVAAFRIFAETQADDGAAIRDGVGFVEQRLEDLPPVSDLVARAREVANRIATQRAAPVGEEYTGPVLIEGRASPVFVASTLIPYMVSNKAPEAENPQVAQMALGMVTPFLSRIGLRVLPDAFSVSDTPSLRQFGGKPVPGSYVVDDEGVPAKDVTLVEKGRLLTLLTGRAPQKNLLQSNGHFRAGGAQAGVFHVRSVRTVPASELRTKYLEHLKSFDRPFGYIVRAIQTEGGGGNAGPEIAEAIKITQDGKEEVVRGLRFAGVPPTVFRDLLEASDQPAVFSDQVAAENTIVSVIAPSLIFEELEIQRNTDIAQKPPIVPSPLKP